MFPHYLDELTLSKQIPDSTSLNILYNQRLSMQCNANYSKTANQCSMASYQAELNIISQLKVHFRFLFTSCAPPLGLYPISHSSISHMKP